MLNKFIEEIPHLINKSKENMGRVNVLIVGEAGVGKSTLINAIFGKNLVAVGVGKPVTKEFKEIRDVGNSDSTLGLFDSEGFELKEYKKIIDNLEKFIKGKAGNTDPNEHIHITWLCIEESNRRVQDGVISAAKMLAEYMPVIVVITKPRNDISSEYNPQTGETKEVSFQKKVLELVPEAQEVIRVNAIETKFDDGYVIKASGLKELVEATDRLVPEAHKTAFIASQKVDLKKKVEKARGVVYKFAGAAAATATVPANLTPPGGHSTLLVLEQGAMFASISLVFGLNLEEAFFRTLISSVIGGSVATAVGQEVFRRLVELIPGAGVAASAAVGAGTAGTITTIMGMAYVTTLEIILEKNPDPSPEEIAEEFKKELSKTNYKS